MNRINVFLVLLIVLVGLLFTFVILLIIFRDSIKEACCGRNRRSQRRQREPSAGLRNMAFEDQEGSAQPRPFSNMESIESPPSYEEAVKLELFRFQGPISTPANRSDSSQLDNNERGLRASSSNMDENDAETQSVSNISDSMYSASHTIQESCRAAASSMGSPLSTIEEEDFGECPVTVVIDCIGIQASKLIENCKTSVDLTDGSELQTHSKC